MLDEIKSLTKKNSQKDIKSKGMCLEVERCFSDNSFIMFEDIIDSILKITVDLLLNDIYNDNKMDDATALKEGVV